ncbi:MAG: hypothetical protein NW223_20755 [Hyphomicrobiaceae bacterium]|nr:hypothetical protein [Hyphomicrobiaceae bacterium]
MLKALAALGLATAALAIPTNPATAMPRLELAVQPAATQVHLRKWRSVYGPLRFHRVRPWGPPYYGYLPVRTCGWVYSPSARGERRLVRYRDCIGW